MSPAFVDSGPPLCMRANLFKCYLVIDLLSKLENTPIGITLSIFNN